MHTFVRLEYNVEYNDMKTDQLQVYFLLIYVLCNYFLIRKNYNAL